jgi:DNA repair protein RadA/Sms
MVDVVLYLDGEGLGTYRVLRSVKNRFGSTNEVAMFQMGDRGLEEVPDPSQALLSERQNGAIGSAIAPVLEGSRPLTVEIQALTSPSILPAPRRTANGVDYNRMVMIATVLSRRARLALANQDIIVNVAGGLKVSEPGADLAVALAITSSLRNLPIKPGLIAIGEVGLSGELRSVSQLDRRIAEAARLGFSTCLVPTSAQGKTTPAKDLNLVHAPTVAQAAGLALEHGSGGQGQR